MIRMTLESSISIVTCFGQWFWLSQQSGRFQHQRSTVCIQSLANFYAEHLFTVNCKERMKIKKKRQRSLIVKLGFAISFMEGALISIKMFFQNREFSILWFLFFPSIRHFGQVQRSIFHQPTSACNLQVNRRSFTSQLVRLNRPQTFHISI